jgi:transcriptional regulator of acetoin/glycerol metabolism
MSRLPVYGPQLTVLNILTGDLDLTNHAARMFALLAIAEAPAELRESYTRIIRAVAPESARAALEELMMTHLRDDFVDGFLDQGRAEGRAQGVAQGEAHLLLRFMAARGLDIPDHIRARVAGCTDTARLEAWADRAATATSVAEIFGN